MGFNRSEGQEAFWKAVARFFETEARRPASGSTRRGSSGGRSSAGWASPRLLGLRDPEAYGLGGAR